MSVIFLSVSNSNIATPSTKLSVLIPTNKVDDFFHQALKSIQLDLPKNSEITVVLNGKAVNYFDELNAKAFENVIFLKSPEENLVTALNLGLLNCNGLYVARMDADDIVLPGRFQRQLSYMEAHPAIGVVGTSAIEICAHGRFGKKWLVSRGFYKFPWIPVFPKVIHPTALIRKKTLLNVSGYREVFPSNEDTDLWLRILKVSKIRNLRFPGIGYRIHPEQVSQVDAKRQKVNTLRTYLFNILGSVESSADLKQNLEAVDSYLNFRELIFKYTKSHYLQRFKLLMALNQWKFVVELNEYYFKSLRWLIRNFFWLSIYVLQNPKSVIQFMVDRQVPCEICKNSLDMYQC